jgi:NADPH:quinone reductase-like Zn-dependent oxidoreductase
MTLPAFHRVLRLTSRDQPLTIESVPTPQPVPGSAVVRVLAAGVLSYAGEVYSGKRPYPFPLPFTPGSSAIARVVALGPDATSLKPGQLVIFDCTIRARDDPGAIFLSGLSEGWTEGSRALMHGEWRESTYAEYAKCPLENCIPLDEARLLGDPRAGGLGYSVEDLMHIMAIAVSFGGLNDVGLKAGETVVIAPATGNFGGAAVHVALALGAKVVAMGRNADVLAHLTKLNPSRVSTVQITSDADADTAALQAAARAPIDVFFDISPPMAAHSSHVRSGIAAVRHSGRISLMGGIAGDVAFTYKTFMRRNLSMKGTWMYSREQLLQLVKMVEVGVLPIGKSAGMEVTGKFKLEEWQQAFDAAASNAGPGKVTVLVP